MAMDILNQGWMDEWMDGKAHTDEWTEELMDGMDGRLRKRRWKWN